LRFLGDEDKEEGEEDQKKTNVNCFYK
jgi:hypothetical protein